MQRVIAGLRATEIRPGRYWYFKLKLNRYGNPDKKHFDPIQEVNVVWEPMVGMYEILDLNGLFLARDFMLDLEDGEDPIYMAYTEEEIREIWNLVIDEELKKCKEIPQRVLNLRNLKKG